MGYRKSARAFLVLVLTLALAGCARNGDKTEAPRSQEQTRVVEVDQEPQITTPLAAVQEASITLPGEPDWLTSHGGFVWVKRADGFVTRIDPRTSRSSGEVHADTKSEQTRRPFCEGIGSGGGAVWSCSGSDVVRIDPKRLKVVASIPVRKVFAQGRLVFAGGRIWVISGEGDRLVGIDVSTNRIGPPIELPVACDDLGPGVDTVWVICPSAGTVLALDPASGSIDGRFELANPAGAFGTESDLWVGYEEGLARIDVKTLRQVARFAGLPPVTDLTVAEEDVWVRTETGFLHRIDATSNTVAEQVHPKDAFSSGGSVLVAAGSVWVSAYDDDILLRLRRRH
jgi:streptogramin lyase